MLSELSVENMKAFRDSTSVPLGAMTLLYGPNSSGKSTLLQSLLLFGQTIRRAHTGSAGRLGIKGPWADLGSEMSLVYGHDRSRPLGVGVAWSNNGRTDQTAIHSTFRWERGKRPIGENVRPELWETRLSLGGYDLHFVRRTAPRSTVIDADYFALGSSADAEAFGRIISDRLEVPGYSEFIHGFSSGVLRPSFVSNGLLPGTIMRYVHTEHASDVFSDEEYGQIRSKDAEAAISSAWAGCARDVARKAAELCDNLSYLGPLRHAPERFVILTGEPGHNVGVTGALATEVLAGDPRLLELVSEWLYRLELPYSIAVERVGGDATQATVGELLALVLTDVRNGVRVAATDVGFGVSQLLPIVVQCLLSSKSVIVIEQPEIHVHPRLQAELADLLVASVVDRGNQLLVETHSEHILLRLQRRLRTVQRRTFALRPDDICVLYVESLHDGRAAVTRIPLGQDGAFLEEWPEGFFEERYNEMFARDVAPPSA